MDTAFSPPTVAAIVRVWGSGSSENDILTKSGRIDRRKASKADIKEAWIQGLCDQSGAILRSSVVFPHQLPSSVLWELLGAAIAECSGFSLANHPVWRDLGLWEVSRKPYFQDWMLQEMEQCLVALDMAGKITFLNAGTIWDISIKSE
jgi:hypothetical protein